MRKDKFIYTHALKSIVGHKTTCPSATCCLLERELFHRPESKWTPNMVLTTYHHDLLYSNKPYIHRKRVKLSKQRELSFFLFTGQKPTTWPANNCLQVMVYSCAMSSNLFSLASVLLQIIFFSCLNETTRFFFATHSWMKTFSIFCGFQVLEDWV